MSSADEQASDAEPLDRETSDALVKNGSGELNRLLEIMRRLRDPETGCPWDAVQTFESIARYTIEEAYEVADAIERKNLDDLNDELGDLLLQVVYHARIAEERGAFGFADVVRSISDKMVRRHPHVFDGAEAFDWEELKATERAAKAQRNPTGAVGQLDDVPRALPALSRALKLQKRAAKVGFDWTDAADVLAKVEEEARELIEVRDGGGDPDRLEDEFGDLLFVVVNLGRHLKVDPEAALTRTNAKFVRRFSFVEQALAQEGRSTADASLDDMERLWNAAKADERAAAAESDREDVA